ncbi:hypothetical protein AB1Y20_008437 [Prymnesium parvum]|uniref:HD domain-containing protein n=1 Tax=Prymnesium parvum TaxID=97485 RepID=A0AB34IR32_PRYPA
MVSPTLAALSAADAAYVAHSAPGPKPRDCRADLIPALQLSRPRAASEPERAARRSLVEISTEWLPLPPGRRRLLPHLRASLEEPRSASDGPARRLEIVFERHTSRHTARTIVSLDHSRLLRLFFWVALLSSLSTAAGYSLAAAAARPAPLPARPPARAAPSASLLATLRAPVTLPFQPHRRRAAPFASLPSSLHAPISLPFQPHRHAAPAAAARPFSGTSRAHPALAVATAQLRDATRYLRHHAAEIEQAVEFAVMAHEGQWRKSGEPFVVHPIEVACILAELKMDTDTIIAGLLHDVVEDTAYTVEDIRQRFGTAVARIVWGVTDGDGCPASDNQRDLLLAMSAEWRVVLLKLADRLHNMRTLGAMPHAKRVRKARETMQLFVPLAARVGITPLEAELRRLSAAHLHPFAPSVLGALPGSHALLDWLAERQCPATLDNLLRSDEELAARGVGWEIAGHRQLWEAHCARWTRDADEL